MGGWYPDEEERGTGALGRGEQHHLKPKQQSSSWGPRSTRVERPCVVPSQKVTLERNPGPEGPGMARKELEFFSNKRVIGGF